MRTIDENTILFRNGSTTYVTHMRGPCNGIGGGNYALVTRQYGTADLCSGDIAQVVDTVNGILGRQLRLGRLHALCPAARLTS